MSPPTESPQADDADELGSSEAAVPCAVGLIAATMALMTAHAAPEPGARIGAAQQRHLMARKIVSNLFFLAQHPELPPGLRRVVHQLHGRWSEQACGKNAPMAAAAAPVLH